MNAASTRGPDRFELENRPAPENIVNDVVRLLAAHRSVRAYKPDPLPPGTLAALVTAAQSASTSSNLQAYSIIAVRDQEKKKRIAEWSENPFAVDAPVILVFCPDLHRLEVVSGRQGREFADKDTEMFIVSVVDAALAAQNTAIAAESMGLGMCFLGGVRNETAKMAELLQLPPRTFALVGMTIGYPLRSSRVRHRLPADVVLHYDTYSDANLDAQLKQFDELTAASGIYDGRQLPAVRVEGSDMYGWCEHTARRMATPTPKRKNMLQQLKDLGWEFE